MYIGDTNVNWDSDIGEEGCLWKNSKPCKFKHDI